LGIDQDGTSVLGAELLPRLAAAAGECVLKSLSLMPWNGGIRSGKCLTDSQGEDACGQICGDVLNFSSLNT
jgi:hypothetical protein